MQCQFGVNELRENQASEYKFCAMINQGLRSICLTSVTWQACCFVTDNYYKSPMTNSVKEKERERREKREPPQVLKGKQSVLFSS
jgi:hypothetical protein